MTTSDATVWQLEGDDPEDAAWDFFLSQFAPGYGGPKLTLAEIDEGYAAVTGKAKPSRRLVPRVAAPALALLGKQAPCPVALPGISGRDLVLAALAGAFAGSCIALLIPEPSIPLRPATPLEILRESPLVEPTLRERLLAAAATIAAPIRAFALAVLSCIVSLYGMFRRQTVRF